MADNKTPPRRAELFRPSSEGMVHCAAASALSFGHPHRRESGDAAADGNRLHDIAAKVFEAAMASPNYMESLRSRVFIAEACERLGASEADIEEALAPWFQWIDPLIFRPVPGKGVQQPALLNAEFPLENKEIQVRGTCDLIVYHEPIDDLPAMLTIVDLKTGMGVPVDARKSIQLWLYLAMAVIQLQSDGLAIPGDALVRVAAVQPRSRFGRVFTEATTDIDGVIEVWQFVRGGIVDAATSQTEATLSYKAGNHCRYCPALERCPEARRVIEEFRTYERDRPITSALTAAQITEMVDAFKLAEPIIKAMKSKVNDLLQDPDLEIPGYEMTTIQGKAEFNGRAIAIIRKEGRSNKAFLAVCKPLEVVSPNELKRTEPGLYKKVVDKLGGIEHAVERGYSYQLLRPRLGTPLPRQSPDAVGGVPLTTEEIERLPDHVATTPAIEPPTGIPNPAGAGGATSSVSPLDKPWPPNAR